MKSFWYILFCYAHTHTHIHTHVSICNRINNILGHTTYFAQTIFCRGSRKKNITKIALLLSNWKNIYCGSTYLHVYTHSVSVTVGDLILSF